MLIRKLFKFESSHIVRGCSTQKCSKNVHGHSYKVELFISSYALDAADMVLDFGLLKNEIGRFIDAFDHTHVLCAKRSTNEEIQFFTNNYERWIVLPVNPTAEGFALVFLKVIGNLLERTSFTNGEMFIKLVAVRVHETETGWAEARVPTDGALLNLIRNEDIIISPAILNSWPNPNVLIDNSMIVNPKTV